MSLHHTGKKRAVIAVAHSILVMAYHMSKRQEPYRELGSDFFDNLNRQASTMRMVRRLGQLGYKVNLVALTATPA